MGFLLWQWTGWKCQNFKCCRCAKFSPRHCKSKIPAHLKLSTQMPTFNIFELKQSFRKSVEYLWRYRIFAVTVNRLKVGNFKWCRCAKFSACRCKSKIPAHLKHSTQMPLSRSSRWGKDFENRLNTFGDIGFLLAQCTGWKWQNFKWCRCAKFSACRCKSKIPAQLKHSTQIPHLKIFALRQRFRKSAEYLWRYRIFAGTVYRLKVAKFQMFSMRNVFTSPLQK